MARKVALLTCLAAPALAQEAPTPAKVRPMAPASQAVDADGAKAKGGTKANPKARVKLPTPPKPVAPPPPPPQGFKGGR